MKYLITLVIACCLFEANAQISKGSFLVGGSVSLQRVKTKSAAYTTAPPQGALSMSPTAGYFVVDNFMIGLQDNLGYTWVLGEDQTTLSNDIGPIVRYYIPFGKFAVFPEVSGSFGFQHDKTWYFDFDNGALARGDFMHKTSTYKAGMGIAWFVAPNVGLEAILSYKSFDFNADKKATNYSDYTDNRFVLNFGLQFYLARKAS